MRMRAWFDNVRTDVRHAVRSLRRSPGFAAVAMLALAVGIGGNTAIFSVIDATRAQAIPYDDPERLVISSARPGARPSSVGVRRIPISSTGGRRPRDLRGPRGGRLAVDDARRHATNPERIETEFVSASYFSLLGATPALGRTFRADEDDVAKPAAVVVLSDGLWRRRFAADPQVVGRSVTLNGQPFTVARRDAAPGFTGVTDEAQLWIPFAQWAPARDDGRTRQSRILRPRPIEAGCPREAAQSEVDTIVASRLAARVSDDERSARHRSESAGDRGTSAGCVSHVRLLMAAIAFVPDHRVRERGESADRSIRSAAPRDRAANGDRCRSRRGCCSSW